MTNRTSQVVGAADLSVSRQYLNISTVADDTKPLPLVASAPGSGLTPLDLALADGSIALATTTSSMSPVVRIRLDSRVARSGKTSPATIAPPVSAIDRAALDVLLSSGWRARLSWVADRPRPSIEKLF